MSLTKSLAALFLSSVVASGALAVPRAASKGASVARTVNVTLVRWPYT